MLDNNLCATEMSTDPSTFRNQESTSKSIYKHFLLLHLSTHLPSGFPNNGWWRFPVTWLFCVSFLSNQQMCAKSKIIHTTGCLLSQRGCGKGKQVIYNSVELSVIISSYCYFCVSLGIAPVKEQGYRKHIYKTVGSSFPMPMKQLANRFHSGVINSLLKSLNGPLFSS